MQITIDNQPTASSFFGQGKWLTEYVTPNDLEVQELHKEITAGISGIDERILACWDWVANQVKYVKFVQAKINVAGRISIQEDYWQPPGQVIRTKVGNCCNKSFLLASLLRNELPDSHVFVVLGNLNQPPAPGGHAWVEVEMSDRYIMESTRGDMQPLVKRNVANVYEDVIHFNDKEVSIVDGRTVVTPFSAVYADWLRDYLDWAFIEGRK